MTYYIVLPMKNTVLFIESSDDAVKVTNRLAHIQNQPMMDKAVVVSKNLYEKLMMKPLSTKEKVQLFHDLYVDCKAFCRLQKDHVAKSKILFKNLVRKVTRMASQGITLSIAIESVKATLGAE